MLKYFITSSRKPSSLPLWIPQYIVLSHKVSPAMACGSEFMLQLKEAASKEPGVYGNPPWDKDTVLSTDGFA